MNDHQITPNEIVTHPHPNPPASAYAPARRVSLAGRPKPWRRLLPQAGEGEGHPRPLWWYIATFFGVGLSPVMSGTAGSLAALPFAYLIHITLGNFALCAASFLVFFIGCWASEKYVQSTGKSDPSEIVIDEVAGQWLLLSILVPSWQWYLTAFVLFRLFDIVKPWPVSWADAKVKGGLGVMLDDMLAAAYPIIFMIVIMLLANLLGAQDLLTPFYNFLGGAYVH